MHVVARPPAADRGRPLEVLAKDGAALRGTLSAPVLTWIGHATFLVQLDGVNVAEIARRLGPIDVAALPIGGYSDYPRHHPNHVSPEEAVRAFQDLGARLLVPMHWGTFELNREPYGEPPDRLLRETQRHGLEEDMAVLSPGQTIRW